MGDKKEIWKHIKVDGRKPKVPYVISNHGRFGVKPEGAKQVEVRTFKPTAGNYRYNTRQDGKNKAIFISREVANAFLNKTSSKHIFIIHKDHNYLNNHVDNLKWVSAEEHRRHTTFSPNSVLARARKAITQSKHAKVLNEKTVEALKKIMWDPKRKLSFKKLAEKFGVSEMQIYRIKSGRFWYHVRVENEPMNPKYKQNLINISYQEKKAALEAKTKLKAKKATKKTASKNTVAKNAKKIIKASKVKSVSSRTKTKPSPKAPSKRKK
jgi:hypothetical protein